MIRATNFRQFVDFASPAFFDVVPTRSLVGEARSLVGAYRDRDAFRRAVEARREAVQAGSIPVEVVDPEASRGASRLEPNRLDDDTRREVGRRILTVYFHQLFTPTPTLLDTSRDRWSWTDDGRLQWRPGRGHKDWDEDFRTTMVEVYRGFYESGEEELRAALSRLDLDPATDLFIEHFGAGDQTQVRFRVQHFTRSFHQVFVRCREEGIRLHRGFLPLGIYLATLYQTLEALEVPLDARGAFFAAREASSGR